jgi:hypothetical protein
MLLIASLLFASIQPMWNHWAVDLSAYYYAGHFFQLGQFDQIYAGPPDIIGPEMPLAWVEAARADGFGDELTYPFIYLPWVAAAMAPVSATFPPMVVMNFVLVANATLLAVSIFLAWRLVGAGRVSLLVWILASVILIVTSATSVFVLHLGQVQVLVYVSILFAVDRLRSGKDTQAALALALAACLKITPAAFAIILLWNRKWHALFCFIAVCVLFMALCVSVIGWPLHAQYISLMSDLKEQIFLSRVGVSAEGFLYQVADYLNGTAPFYWTNEYSYPKPDWQNLIIKGGFVGGLVAIWLTTRKMEEHDRHGFQLFSLAILVPLMAPLGWIHYFLLATLFAPVLLAGNRPSYIALLGSYGIVFSIFGLIVAAQPGFLVMGQYMICVPLLVAMFITSLTMAARQAR